MVRISIPHTEYIYMIRLLLEYVGAPESARLLSRSPEYWLHHMGREKMTLSAALQLQHDAGPDFVEHSGPAAVRDIPQPDVLGGHACGLCTGSRFRRMRCRMWRRLIVFNGRHITWRPWDCGVHPVRRGFMAPCRRRRATPACHLLTASRISHSSIV